MSDGKPTEVTPEEKGGDISLRLTRAQVREITRAAAHGNSVSAPTLPVGLGESRPDLTSASLEKRLQSGHGKHFSRSLLRGLLIQRALADEKAWGVKEIAREIGISSSTAHRYLVTLLFLGVVERDPETRKYQAAP
jgi:hypothetical protein